MRIAIVGALVALPEGDEDKIVQKDIFIEGDQIVGVGSKPQGFVADKEINGTENKINLILSSDQKELKEEQHVGLWEALKTPYADSYDHGHRYFMNNYFESIICGHSKH